MRKQILNLRNALAKSFLLVSVVAIQGCIYPKAPRSTTVSKIQALPGGKSEWIQMAPYRKTSTVGPRGQTVSITQKRSKNLLFIAADDVIGKRLQPEFAKIYKRSDIRLENILWWLYAPKIQKTYNYVLRIQWDGFNKDSFLKALRQMESLKQDYDVMLLAHGIPNHLISSPGQGVISFRDIGALKGKLRYADGLYLQACFGNSLSPDFLDAGFKSVIAYEGLNWNFFYPDYFLDAMALKKGNVEKSHDHVLEHFDGKLKWSVQDRQVLKRVFGEKPAEYLDDVQLPELYY